MKAHVLVAAAIALILTGCASIVPGSPGTDAPTEPVSVALVSGRDLRARFGQTFRDNPFISPKPTIMDKTEDFIVLQVTVTGGSAADLEVLRAEAVDEKGSVCAPSYTREKFTELAMMRSGLYTDSAGKSNKIGWYYMPAMKTRVPAGTHSYLLVLVGKHPLPENVIAQVQLRFQGEEKSFELPVNVAEAE